MTGEQLLRSLRNLIKPAGEYVPVDRLAFPRPCKGYDEAGKNAIHPADGLPQCAWCGWPKTRHKAKPC